MINLALAQQTIKDLKIDYPINLEALKILDQQCSGCPTLFLAPTLSSLSAFTIYLSRSLTKTIIDCSNHQIPITMFFSIAIQVAGETVL